MARRLPVLVPAALAVALAVAVPGRAAEDRITVRGAYFREASTRVVQPMFEVTKTLPRGFDLGGHFLVDAISSASIAQGARTDNVFHENRYEGGARAGYTWNLLRVGVFGRVSREPDYLSRTVGLSLTQELWGRTGTLGLNLAYTHDDINPPPPLEDKDLDVLFAGLAYTQVLSPTTVAQVNYEVFTQNGYFANPYISHPDLGRERIPDVRWRHAFAGRVAQYLPRLALGAQLHYRFYLDRSAIGDTGPWGMSAHTLEARLYKELGPIELRLMYRYHRQFQANFWCNARGDNGGQLGCYGLEPPFHSWDVKFGLMNTDLVDLKVTWDLHILREVKVLELLAGGSVDLSYGYYFQSSPYGGKFTDKNAPPLLGAIPFTRSHGGAHIMQTGYTLPF